MSVKMTKHERDLKGKNPANPSALRLDQIHIGQTVVRKFSYPGEPYPGCNDTILRIMSEPYVSRELGSPSLGLLSETAGLRIKTLTSYGRVIVESLGDMGVVPYPSGQWKDAYTIKQSKDRQ